MAMGMDAEETGRRRALRFRIRFRKLGRATPLSPLQTAAQLSLGENREYLTAQCELPCSGTICVGTGVDADPPE